MGTERVLEGHPSRGGRARHKVWGHRGPGGSENVGCLESRACFAPLGGFFSNGAFASNHVIVDLLASFVTDESAYSLCARTLSALGACRAIDVAKDVFPRQGAVSI